MKKLNVKRAAISSVMVYLVGIAAFVGSYYFPVLEDPHVQANWVLSLALIPAALLGAYCYYRSGEQTNGWLLGAAMFLVAMALDAIITVPLFIIPNGGSHLSFFTDPGFWLIAVEYLSVVAAYRQIGNAVNIVRASGS